MIWKKFVRGHNVDKMVEELKEDKELSKLYKGGL